MAFKGKNTKFWKILLFAGVFFIIKFFAKNKSIRNIHFGTSWITMSFFMALFLVKVREGYTTSFVGIMERWCHIILLLHKFFYNNPAYLEEMA